MPASEAGREIRHLQPRDRTPGVMKRHGFAGIPPPTVHRNHLAGSIGACNPGRIFRACVWPAAWVATVVLFQSLTIRRGHEEGGLLLINGAIPGPKNGVVWFAHS